MKTLPRLTPKIVYQTERNGKTNGWYELAKMGYSPAEIAINTKNTTYASDITLRVRGHAQLYNLPIPANCAKKREYNKPRIILDWKEAFRNTVMRTGMQLSLTQPMLEYLCAASDNVVWDRLYNSTQVRPACCLTTEVSLEKRGLLKRKVSGVRIENNAGDAYCELTEAGQIVVSLLKCAGVFYEADEAIKRRIK